MDDCSFFGPMLLTVTVMSIEVMISEEQTTPKKDKNDTIMAEGQSQSKLSAEKLGMRHRNEGSPRNALVKGEGVV